MQPRHRAHLLRQQFPPGNGPNGRLRFVLSPIQGNRRRDSIEADSSPSSLKIADCGSISLGDDKHSRTLAMQTAPGEHGVPPDSMEERTSSGRRHDPDRPVCLRTALERSGATGTQEHRRGPRTALWHRNRATIPSAAPANGSDVVTRSQPWHTAPPRSNLASH
jgi:hypothetical protein